MHWRRKKKVRRRKSLFTLIDWISKVVARKMATDRDGRTVENNNPQMVGRD
jgi:hypothetical protein